MVDELTRTPTTSRIGIPHLLAGLEALYGRIGHEMAQRASGVPLRGSQGRIINLIGPHGTRPTVLADGSAMTKQAIGKRIRDLEERGLVTVEPDPDDGRAVRVHRTTAGDEAMTAVRRAIDEMEHVFADQVGAERYAVFRDVLEELAADHLPAALIELQRGGAR